MIKRSLASIVIVSALAIAVTGCANTIRGMGQDTAEAVDATQDAGRNIEGSAAY